LETKGEGVEKASRLMHLMYSGRSP
jgi:hypothetical protein